MLKGYSVAVVLHSRHNSVSQGYSVGQVMLGKKKKVCAGLRPAEGQSVTCLC